MNPDTNSKTRNIIGFQITDHMHKILRFILYTLIIFASHISAGLFLQKIYKTPYSSQPTSSSATPTQDYFSDPFAIPLFNSFFGMIYGFFKYDIARSNQNRYNYEQTIPRKTILTLCSLDCIIHVLIQIIIILTSFTILNIFNCCNLLSVVLFAVFLSGMSQNENARVQKSQILVAGIITCGILFFNAVGDDKESGQNKPLTLFPFALIVILLLIEGYKPQKVAQIKEQFHPAPSLLYYQVMKFNFLILLVISILSMHLWKTLVFIWAHDDLSFDLLIQATLSMIGDIVCYRVYMVHKQHMVTFICTIRKLLSTIINIIYFHHKIVFLQYIGLGIIASGIMIALFLQWHKNNLKQRVEKVNELEDQVEDTI